MAEEGGLVGDAEAGDGMAAGEGLQNNFSQVVHVALGVDAARNRQPDQVHGREVFGSGFRVPLSEHHAADLDAADSAGLIQRADEGLAGILLDRYLWEKGASVDVDGMAAGRLDHGNSAVAKLRGEVLDASMAV